MKIGLLIAIERELKSFLDYGTDVSEETVYGRKIYKTRIGAHEIFALCSGWGEIDAAAGTQLLILACGCEAILNFGVTGALKPELKVDDLFLVRRVCHYDFDTSGIDHVRKYQYVEFPDEFIPLDPDLFATAEKLMPELKSATVASGDKFVEDLDEKRRLAAIGCDICDMEIAAIARVCFLNNVPCFSVKSISDTLYGNGADFEKNVVRSAAKAFRALLTLMEHL